MSKQTNLLDISDFFQFQCFVVEILNIERCLLAIRDRFSNALKINLNIFNKSKNFFSVFF